MEFRSRKNINGLFERYLKGNCSQKEKNLVESYLDSYQQGSNEKSLVDFKQEIDERLWEKIIAAVANKSDDKLKYLATPKWIKYAAVFVGVILSYFTYQYIESADDNQLNIGEVDIVLLTGVNENEIVIKEKSKIINTEGKVIASVENGILKYKKSSSKEFLNLNEIKVPFGRTFQLVLSDGTHIILNSGSSLRYPVNFDSDRKREVYLSGEAYFEVAKSETSPFVVNSDGMEVRVLGTHFNVSSYKGEMQHTVLVEGSVSVNNQQPGNTMQLPQILEPGQQAVISPQGLQVNEVDVGDYIGWTKNMLIFSNERFPMIIRKIERRYNVEIENNYRELDSVHFNGKFKNESIISLMNTFKESANFDYEINKGKIIINKKQ